MITHINPDDDKQAEEIISKLRFVKKKHNPKFIQTKNRYTFSSLDSNAKIVFLDPVDDNYYHTHNTDEQKNYKKWLNQNNLTF
jgi:hypothetical protein